MSVAEEDGAVTAQHTRACRDSNTAAPRVERDVIVTSLRVRDGKIWFEICVGAFLLDITDERKTCPKELDIRTSVSPVCFVCPRLGGNKDTRPCGAQLKVTSKGQGHVHVRARFVCSTKSDE